MKTKKIIIKIMVAIMIFTPAVLTVSTIQAEAAAPAKKYRSDYTKYRANVVFSKSYIKKVISNEKKWNKKSNLLFKYLAGFAHFGVGYAILAMDVGYSNIIGKFKTAKKKGKRLKMSYDIYVPKFSGTSGTCTGPVTWSYVK